MAVDAKTIAVYAARARDYAEMAASSQPDADLTAFVGELPAGGRVLDLGCGPATASAHMRAAGLVPDPVDATPEMVALANEIYDIGARLGSFDDLTVEAVYDGVWANFSLLHAPRADLPRHFAAISRALVAGGVLHVAMKTGTGEARDLIDRHYTYVTVPELHGLLRDAGLRVTATREGAEVGLAGTNDPYVIARARKGDDG